MKYIYTPFTKSAKQFSDFAESAIFGDTILLLVYISMLYWYIHIFYHGLLVY